MFDKLFNRGKSETRQDKAKAIITSALELPPIQGLTSVNDWLNGVLDKLKDKPGALEQLEQLNESLMLLLDRAIQEIGAAQSNATRVHLLLQAAQPFCTTIANGYARAVIKDGPTLAKQSSQIGAVQTGISSFMFWAAKGFLLQLLSNPQQNAFPWAKIYPLYDFGVKIEASPLARIAGASSSLSTIQRQLAYLLLLARTVSSDLTGKQILIADRLVQMLSPFVQIHTEASADTPFATQENDSPPTLVGNTIAHQAPDHSSKRFYFGLERCSIELSSLEHLITSHNHVPAKLDPEQIITVPEALAVINHTMLRWRGQRATRMEKRVETSGPARLVYEFLPIRRLISLMDVAGSSNTIEPTRVDCILENISARGMGLVVKPGSTWMKIGRLVSIKQAGSSRWSIGVVRRIVGRAGGETQVGCQVLSAHPESVRLAEKTQVSTWEQVTGADVYHNFLGIFLPADADHPPSLLLETRQLVTGHSYLTAISEGKAIIRIIGPGELGADFVQYQCELEVLPNSKEPPPDSTPPTPKRPRLNII